MLHIKLLGLLLTLADLNLGKQTVHNPALPTLPPLMLPPIKVKNGVFFFTNSNGTLRKLPSRAERFNEKNENFQKDIDKIGSLPLKGENLDKVSKSSKSALDRLKEKGSKGIVLKIENYSGRLLLDHRSYVRCGYEDEEFPVFESLPPGTADIALLHNKGKLRSSCGSISWQLMESPAKPYRMTDGKGLRLYFTWSNLDTVGSHRCADDKQNEFIVGFKQVELDSTGHYDEEWKKELWKTMHTKDNFEQFNFQMNTSVIRNTSMNSLASIVESPDSQIEVRAEMEPGCLTHLTLQILGRRGGAVIQESDLGLAEAKYSDEVWEQMIRQAWLDIVNSINRDKGLYGVNLEPMLVDPLMKEAIFVNTSLLGYEVEFLMWNVSIDGLSTLKLEELVLERGESLKNLETRAVLDIGNLTVKGRYMYKAIYTGWVWGMDNMDSGGEQKFNVDMTGAKFKVEIGMDTIDGCNRTSDLVITKMKLPVVYESVNFNFENIGAILGGAINIIGDMALQLSEDSIVTEVKNAVQKEISSFICSDSQKNSSKLERMPLQVDETKDERWHAILENGTRGWGIDTLRRDILAEKFVTKVFNEGVAKHFADPNDPIVKLLDPFQMLPVNEDFRQPGLIKGHVVVCDFWLYDLSKLKLLDMQLARNDDMTYSALKVKIGLPTTSIRGKYRLNNVKVMSVIPAPKSEGTMDISLTGVTVDLHVVLRATPVKNQGNASIAIELFEVNFDKEDVAFNITGLAKGMNTVTNKVSNALGNKILSVQKEVLNTEIRHIIYGLADCLMYKPGMGLTKCLDAFWESLGYEVPFKFPSCQELYNEADKKLGLI